MIYFLTIPLAFLPSLVWLLYYLAQDKHPEPKKMIVRTFILGMAVAPIVALFQFGFAGVMQNLSGINVNPALVYSGSFFSAFVVISLITLVMNAFIEEFFKYVVVWKNIIKTKFYDEPVDAVEYLIIAALGFAAVENVLIAMNYTGFSEFIVVLSFRFLGATLIHAVSAATLGYFLARGTFLKSGRKRPRLLSSKIIPGLFFATLLHSLYNWLIIESGDLSDRIYIWWIAALLIGAMVWVSWALWKLNGESSRK